jgi:hypothetical protein
MPHTDHRAFGEAHRHAEEDEPMNLTKILVIASALMFAAFGLLGMMDPLRTLELIHMQPKDITAVNEVRAMYGGFELGVTAFLVACLLDRWSLRAGLFLTTAIFLGAAGGRAMSVVADGMPDPLFVQIWVFEMVFAALCIFALARSRD